ncbi:MAG: DUF4131 domain-containing protein, partial [Clostridiales bacterium]|nr:DUF4131 domain-containing protein [Clostridiales bacterium]
MKRPLIVLAAGFVLGEVLALQGQKAVSQGLLWWLYAAAGLFGVWSYRMLFPPSGGKRQGSSAGKTALLLFFVLAAGGCAGYARGAWERDRLDREEVSAGEFAGARAVVQGTIGKAEPGEGSLSLVLEAGKARVGKVGREYDRVIVYVKDEGDGGLPRLFPGMAVEIRGKLEAIERPRNPGEFDFRRYY